jgi:meso-butanediol dehydrogenase/(S,S)-butanediol dehydrogenase/diacetyl reductase
MNGKRKVAVVTGAGSGIGGSIAATLAGRGFRVWLADLHEETARAGADAIFREAGSADARRVDVTDPESVGALVDFVFEREGRVDVVAANAGVSTMNGLLDLTDDEWDFNMNVNAKGVFLTVQAFARRMVEQDLIEGSELRGKIIATASMAARQAAPLLAHYSASKFAVVGFVQAAAKELASHRLTVNAVNPGFVRTSMQHREVEWEAKLRGMAGEQVVAEYIAMTPLGRLQTPEDVAKVYAFLAGPDSDFMTGEVIEVNGGAYMT